MKCPSCKDHNLVISERKGVEIDYCPECRGVWLDRGELDKILEKSRDEEAPRRVEGDRYEERPRGDYDRKHYKRRKSFLEELFD